LATLTSGYRVVSYFALGTTLIAISFLYQYFSKRLELKEETTFENKNDTADKPIGKEDDTTGKL
jgi:hypothetical protein